jgi:hypothetical protein
MLLSIKASIADRRLKPEFYETSSSSCPVHDAVAGMGLKFHIWGAAYDLAVRNAKEAKAIAEAVIRHRSPGPNVGRCRFSVAQRQAVLKDSSCSAERIPKLRLCWQSLMSILR